MTVPHSVVETTTGPFGQAQFRIAVVPARAAYLIGAGSSTGLRRAVQEASTRWAGVTEPIIPVRKSESVDAWWLQLLEISAVDGLVNVDADPNAAKTLAKEVALPLTGLDRIDSEGITRLTAHPAAIYQGAASRPVDSALISRPDGDLWEVVAAGDLSAEHQEEMEGTRFVVTRPRTADEIGRAQLFKNTLLDVTASQFQERSATGGPWPYPTVLWVTTPNGFFDCLSFWNVRALRPLQFAELPMAIVPHRVIDHWVGFENNLAGVLARPDDIEPDVILCSRSVDTERLDEIAQLMALVPSTEELKITRKYPSPPPKKAPHTYLVNLDVRNFVAFERKYGATTNAVVQLYRDKTPIQVSSPVEFRGQGRMLLRISSPAFNWLPRRTATAELIHRNATWSHGDLQIATSTSNRISLDLRLPSLSDATWSLLGASTTSANLSDKGQLANRLEDLALSDILLGENVMDVIRELTTPRSKELLRELRRLQAEGRSEAELVDVASTWGGRAQRRYQSTAQLKEKVGRSSSTAAERLTAASWAERGLAVRCDQCNLKSFVPLRDTRSEPQCPACGASQLYDGPSAPRMQYRLSPILDRASDQGVVPHLLAIAALRAQFEGTCVLPGVDVAFVGGHNAEIDLFGISDGKVIAGEVKSSMIEFTQSQIERDVQLSSQLNADRHVLACTETVPKPVVDLALKLARDAGMGVMVVGGDQVEVFD